MLVIIVNNIRKEKRQTLMNKNMEKYRPHHLIVSHHTGSYKVCFYFSNFIYKLL